MTTPDDTRRRWECLRCSAPVTDGETLCTACSPSRAPRDRSLIDELRDSEMTPTGRFACVLGVAAVAVGVYVGAGMTATSIGVDGSSLSDLSNAHAVSCGSAFRPEWRSVACDQALSGRKTTAYALLVGGIAVAGGACVFLTQKKTGRPVDDRS